MRRKRLGERRDGIRGQVAGGMGRNLAWKRTGGGGKGKMAGGKGRSVRQLARPSVTHELNF